MRDTLEFAQLDNDIATYRYLNLPLLNFIASHADIPAIISHPPSAIPSSL